MAVLIAVHALIQGGNGSLVTFRGISDEEASLNLFILVQILSNTQFLYNI